MCGCGRSCRLTLNYERQLSEPLPTKPLEASKRRYVPTADGSVWDTLSPPLSLDHRIEVLQASLGMLSGHSGLVGFRWLCSVLRLVDELSGGAWESRRVLRLGRQ